MGRAQDAKIPERKPVPVDWGNSLLFRSKETFTVSKVPRQRALVLLTKVDWKQGKVLHS
jgi:hypothetical protein